MKFLLANENIPFYTVQELRKTTYDVLYIAEKHQGISDFKVLELAHTQERTILTFDRDYGELIFKRKLPCPKAVIYLRMIPKDPIKLAYLIKAFLNSSFFTEGYFYTISDENIRKRPLPQTQH